MNVNSLANVEFFLHMIPQRGQCKSFENFVFAAITNVNPFEMVSYSRKYIVNNLYKFSQR